MRSINEEEEKYINAYCRLSFETWYIGYVDDVVKYINKRGLYESIECAARDSINKVIKIDAVECLSKFELKQFISTVLYFLCKNSEYEIVCAAYYEQQEKLISRAYIETNKEIEHMKFEAEMCGPDYLLNMWSVGLKKSAYLKLNTDKSIKFAYYYDCDDDIIRGSFTLDDKLYIDLINWFQEFKDKEKRDADLWLVCGERPRDYLFYVSFDYIKLGYSSNSKEYPQYLYEIEGHGPITKLLKLPELSGLVKDIAN